MKKRKVIKSKKRKPTKKPIKQLKRGTYRGTAEARKLKQRWMDSLQSMIGDIPVDWNRAAMFYDQGMPVQAAFQKLIQRESTMSNTLRTQPKELVDVISAVLAGKAYDLEEEEVETDTDETPSEVKVDGRSKAVRAYKARVAARSQKTSRKTVTKESNMDSYKDTLDRIYNNLKNSL